MYIFLNFEHSMWFIVPGPVLFPYTCSQGWTLTYFEACPVGQVSVIFTCPN